MSIRCQVKVVQKGMSYNENITLYHHTDGNPEYIISKIKGAYEKYGKDWKGGRAGKVASFLCAVDPGVFEPEEGHELHGDIDYYYILNVLCPKAFSEKIPTWEVETFLVGDVENLKKVKTETIS
jgi:hypothetical protein